MSLGYKTHSRPQDELVYMYYHERYWENGRFFVSQKTIPNSCCHSISLQESDPTSSHCMPFLRSLIMPLQQFQSVNLYLDWLLSFVLSKQYMHQFMGFIYSSSMGCSIRIIRHIIEHMWPRIGLMIFLENYVAITAQSSIYWA